MFLLKDDTFTVKKRGPGYVVGEVNASNEVFDYLKRGQLVMQFKGLQNLFTYMSEYMGKDSIKNSRYKSSTKTGANEFSKFKSYEEAWDVFTNRPHELKQFKESDAMLDGGDASGKEVSYAVTGDFIDIGRFLDGEPEHFGYMDNGNPRGRRVNLYIGVNWQWDVDQEYINHRNKRILRLVDWLENFNIRTSVLVVISSRCIHSEVVIKDHDEMLDLNDLAVVSHSDYLRRIIFRQIENSKTLEAGYGSARDFPRAINYNKSILKPEYTSEVSISVGTSGHYNIDQEFDALEEKLTSISDDAFIEDNQVMEVMGY